MQELKLKASTLYYQERYWISECTTLKHAVPGKRVIKLMFITGNNVVSFNHADVFKVTGVLVNV